MRQPRQVWLPAALGASVLALIVGVGSAAADPKADAQNRKAQVDADVSELAEDLVGTSAELTSAYQRLAEVRGRLPAAQAELDAARAAQAKAERTDAELAGRLVAAEAATTRAQADLDASATEIDTTRQEMGRLAAASYRTGSAVSQLGVVLEADNPDDFADRYILADAVMRNRVGTVTDLTSRQAVQTNARTRVEALTVRVADLREQARQALAAAEAARAEAAARKSEVDTLIADQAAVTAAISARKSEEEAHLTSLKAEQDTLLAQLTAIADAERAAEAARKAAGSGGGGAAGGAAVTGGGVLARPVDTRITSQFGYRIHPIYGTRRLHTGTDFGGPCGTPVRAAADGKVLSAGTAGGYGNRVVLTHGVIGGDSLATAYSHLSRYGVRSGTVTKGEVVGYVGTTGASTGCHLHFEVMKNGGYVNPLPYLG